MDRAALHSQLTSVMEVLANAAVAEICKLVDDGYALLRLQVIQAQRENRALKRRIQLLEPGPAREPGSTGSCSGDTAVGKFASLKEPLMWRLISLIIMRTYAHASRKPIPVSRSALPSLHRLNFETMEAGTVADFSSSLIESRSRQKQGREDAEDVTPLPCSMKQSAHMEVDAGSESLLIKEERLEEDLERASLQGDLSLRAESKEVAVGAADRNLDPVINTASPKVSKGHEEFTEHHGSHRCLSEKWTLRACRFTQRCSIFQQQKTRVTVSLSALRT
ncbi:uncharacterized protein LOC125720664 [Brienomyrus brachyistius]|uniref:uncharacterized protein LOC125720664 n=1 Tax=Brienomyrus brachyistius TaxID=42636 RepID=UPI0020B24EE5|nr:uncharacterized protein LOC125720664 [Brienomyrus brachyistius]